jgi:hypothetical protein
MKINVLKSTNRIIAFGVFAISFVFYLLTLSKTVVFWDVGEFCAAGYLLQVPHPPGAPLFLLVLHLASMLPSAADLAMRMHLVSGVSSALAVMFTYLTTVKLVTMMRGKPDTTAEKIINYGSSVIAAFALGFGFSFWFNAVEAEVYATGALFSVLILWIAVRWWERADTPQNEEYLFLVAYLIGLSVGIHLGAVLMLFGVLMLVYFRRTFIEEKSKSFGITAGSLALFGTILMFLGENEMLGWLGVMVLIALVFVVANYMSFRKFSAMLALAVGIFFIIYKGIVMGFPELLDVQVGESRSIGSIVWQMIPFILVLGAIYGVYWAHRTKHKIIHLACVSFLLIVLGYSTYTLVLVRANVPNMPMNENQPDDLAGLVRYISREQYGSQPLLMPRRWSQEPQHQGIYSNYKTDTEFMWKYQIDHMFNRYMEWNFIGRNGDEQDGGIQWSYTFGIPFFLGLLGMYYHFRKDWKIAITMFTLFVIGGVILALYQNQQQPQPRERDYFYVGAYFVFAIWVGIGVVAVIDVLHSVLKKTAASSGIAMACVGLFTVGVPVNLARQNYYISNRTGNYIAWDYSYNILQSCPPDAILFTNGDNDTFPLWYLQDVEGVRRDVRIVNLSLVNTEWYIKQLKNNSPHGAKPVAISFTDDEINELQHIRWETKEMSIPISSDAIQRYSVPDVEQMYGVIDSAIIKSGEIKFSLEPTMDYGDIKAIRIQDIMVYDIIRSNNWKRPVIFAVTVSPDSKIGLDNYCWYQGLGWELRPIVVPNGGEGIDLPILEKQVMTEVTTPSTTPAYGYRYRNLDNTHIFYDENQKRMVQNYRTAFLRLAIEYSQTNNDNAKANQALERMEKVLPRNVIPMDWRLMGDVRVLCARLGNQKLADSYAEDLIAKCKEIIANNEGEMGGYYNPYRILLEVYNDRKEFQNSLDLLNTMKLQRPGDKSIESQIRTIESQLAAQKRMPANDSAK